MELHEAKVMRSLTKEGGALGKPRANSPGGFIVHHIGNDWAWRPGQMAGGLADYGDHISLTIKFSTFTYRCLVLPKADVVSWGVLKKRDLPREMSHGDLVTRAILWGPIGVILGKAADQAKFDKEGEKPVIGITYRVDGEEHALFLEFAIAGFYRKAHSFLSKALPGRLQE